VLKLHRTCLKQLTMTQISPQRSSLEMSRGSVTMTMTLKQKPTLPSGSCPSLQSEEGTAKSEQFKAILVFFYHKDVHHKYIPPGQTATKEYYFKVVHWLRDAVRSKWPQLWASGDGSFIMTICLPSLLLSCGLFLAKLISPRSVSPPIAQIWLPATFGFSQSYKRH